MVFSLAISMSLYAVSSCQCYYYKEGKIACYNKKITLNSVNVYLAESKEHKIDKPKQLSL